MKSNFLGFLFCRYHIRQPRIPQLKVPEIRPGAPCCDLPPSTPFTNMSRTSRPDKHLDSSHYFATPLPGSVARGPTFKSAHVKEEYRYLPLESNPTAIDGVFSMEAFTGSLNLELLRVVLVVLDVLLLIYRCSRTFVTARTFCQGFEETKDITCSRAKMSQEMKSLQAQLRHDNHGVHTTTMDHHAPPVATGTQDYTVPEYMQTLEGQHHSMLPATPHALNSTHNGNKHDHLMGAGVSSDHQSSCKYTRHKAKVERYKGCLLRLAQCTVIPKLAVGVVVFLLGVLLVQCVQVLLSVEVMAEVDGFRAFLSSLEVQVNQTNWYMAQQAQHFNDITMDIYKSQMKSELSHLQSMLEYFNIGEWRLSN